MATMNPFDLLGDDDTEDLSKLIAKPLPAQPAAAAKSAKPAAAAAKPSAKPLPKSQAVQESKFDAPRGDGRGGSRGDGRGGSRGGGRGRGAGGGRGFNRDSADGENAFVRSNGYSGGFGAPEDREAGKNTERRGYGGPRGGFRGGRRGGFGNGEDADGERPRRDLERRSGTGRGNEFKREGAGRGNWGTPTDDIAPETELPVNEGEKVVDTEKQPGEEYAADDKKDTPTAEPAEKEPEEDKEMTLEEYEKVLEEKRKALLAMKPEERKVVSDKEFKSMQLLSSKKNDEEFFAKLGVDKEKKKESTEKTKKAVSIDGLFKLAERENSYRSGGRGRDRERGSGGHGGENNARSVNTNNARSGNTNNVRSGNPNNVRSGNPNNARSGNPNNARSVNTNNARFGNTNNVPAPSIQDVGQFPSLGGK